MIHSVFGSRLTRAWGLALRKRFCRKFNFELQAAATEDNIVLSLSTSHSFPLDDVARYLHSGSVREVLIQALLDAPMFAVRWRWVAATALALPRMRGGTKRPPQLMRMDAEDLLASVFPDQLACAENLSGERQIPDHPLVAQTLTDCVHVGMDIDGLVRLLRRIEAGQTRVIARDLTEPSPLALEVLNARPYAFLDDAPLEERRTQAVQSRRWLDPETAADLGRLDADAIALVRGEAWPDARSADELHDALLGVAFLSDAEIDAVAEWRTMLDELTCTARATRLTLPVVAGENTLRIWVAAERLPWFDALFPAASREPPVEVPREFAQQTWTAEDALVEIVRARLTALGPVTAADIAAPLARPAQAIDAALLRLEVEGYAMRGQFTSATRATEWCERRLLARIHRYTIKRLRQEIQPVAARDFVRFLFNWQHIAPDARMQGPDALAAVLAQLEGFEAAAAAWEAEILPARVEGYEFTWLDDLCRSGRIVWARFGRPAQSAAGPVRSTPIALVQRRQLSLWAMLAESRTASAAPLSSRAQAVREFLASHGASFFPELAEGTRLLPAELEQALAELVAVGAVHADSFAGLRALLVPAAKRPTAYRRGQRRMLPGIEDAGRWALAASRRSENAGATAEAVEHVARTLLRRYGVVFRALLAREADWLPPWRDLQRVWHRLEARGEIRGGRFVAGFSGEQFALPEAIGLLRQMRGKPDDHGLVCVSGADPLNLLGSVLAADAKVPAIAGARVLYRDGVPIATLVAGEVGFLAAMDSSEQWIVRKVLLQGRVSTILAAEVESRVAVPAPPPGELPS